MSERRAGAGLATRLVAVALIVAGCGWNGMYNARHADRDGARSLLAGDDSAAARSFALASAAAETLLARTPRDRWTPEALALAGRGLAFTGDCGHALSRLDVARTKARERETRESASLAAGWCLVRGARYSEALAVLEPLQSSRDRNVATLATRWTAQALLAQGNAAGAARVLARTDPGAAEWTLARDAFERGAIARAETLLAARVAAHDLRPELIVLLRDLWLHGDTAVAWRVGAAAASSRGQAELRAAVRVTLAELLLQSGRDADARKMLAPVPRLSADTALVARARDAMLGVALRDASTLDEIARDARGESGARGRVASSVLLARMLASRDTATGAGRFLAGEVLRDSIGASRAARTLFTMLPVGSPLAAKGWLAAARLAGDSSARYVEVARSRWPDSPYLRALDGRAGGDTLAIAADTLLRKAWDEAIVVYRDSLEARRAASVPPAAPRP
ncbi:MAG TPA: hypothetical protein VHM30_12105 [Gemmatimonadaceae bacterium]|nr:hypothetical protein [Gemmatimonadaceae bacterium]